MIESEDLLLDELAGGVGRRAQLNDPGRLLLSRARTRAIGSEHELKPFADVTSLSE